ncbi:hypothetical protein [Phenylobacterium sp.]|uniref:hypothetical protein n=1 Tax=Phenylobacterium sp. TaxID=1871053 RepID=UPI0030021A5F
MQQVPPAFKSDIIYGAFVIDGSALRRLEAAVRMHLDGEIATTYELTLVDGSKFIGSTFEEIELMPLHHKERAEFEITFKSDFNSQRKWPRIGISYKYRKEFPRVMVWVAEHTNPPGVIRTLASFANGTRRWYSFLYCFDSSSVFIPPALFSFILFTLWLRYPSPPLIWWGWCLLGASLFGMCAVTVMRRLLFVPIGVLFGEELVREDRRVENRRGLLRWLTGGLLLTLAGAALNAFLMR